MLPGDPLPPHAPGRVAIVGSGREIMGDICWRHRLRLDGGLLAGHAAGRRYLVPAA